MVQRKTTTATIQNPSTSITTTIMHDARSKERESLSFSSMCRSGGGGLGGGLGGGVSYTNRLSIVKHARKKVVLSLPSPKKERGVYTR